MPPKIRELVRNLTRAGFYELPAGGKGSHRKFAHPTVTRVVTLSGRMGDDAKPYQEKHVSGAIEEAQS